ncbi:MAG: hypothetical protein V1793_22905 [Pseudomonadota bacterium]
MTTHELLIIRTGTAYLRFIKEECLACGLDKASVFPMEAMDTVVARAQTLKSRGFPDASVFRLTITETPL